MQRITIVLACLACAGHCQRMQSEDTQALARFLLAANPEGAFNPSSPGTQFPMRKPMAASMRRNVLDGQNAVMRMRDEDVNELRKVFTSAAAVAAALAPYFAAHADGLIPEGNDITPQFIFLNLVGLTIGFGPPLLLAAEFFKQAKTGKFDR
mmetsp:Transcript_145686/g.256910  ORF Transcript_145686/g.256910 Transcript_145686/m.256910 type:complete len:152 (+) Transcript_145686:92-547(+)